MYVLSLVQLSRQSSTTAHAHSCVQGKNCKKEWDIIVWSALKIRKSDQTLAEKTNSTKIFELSSYFGMFQMGLASDEY